MKSPLRRLYWFAGVSVVLLFLFSSCSFPGVVATDAQLPAVSKQEMPQVLPPIHFPQDEGAHNDLNEWWYYTGHLEATDSSGTPHQYGFEMVVFQALRGNLPPVYPAQFAITDITHDQFHYAQRSVTDYTGRVPAGTPTQGINIHVGNWSIQGLNGHDQLSASTPDYTLQLDLNSSKPAVLHNGNGIITYGLGGFSYYYSRTHMNVSGILQDHGQTLKVSGLAWMDHQWGNFLALGDGGWNWYSIQLNNNTEIMLYFVHDVSGQVTTTYGDYVDAAGKDTTIAPSAIHSTVLSTWRSPTTGIIYPSDWRVNIQDPHVQSTLMVTPLVKDQELDARTSTGNIYWEGAVSIQGQFKGQIADGQGYVELTGYTK
jgi:predicted secreted hydrolase